MAELGFESHLTLETVNFPFKFIFAFLSPFQLGLPKLLYSPDFYPISCAPQQPFTHPITVDAAPTLPLSSLTTEDLCHIKKTEITKGISLTSPAAHIIAHICLREGAAFLLPTSTQSSNKQPNHHPYHSMKPLSQEPI